MSVSVGDMSVSGLLRLARSNAATRRRTYAALGKALVDGGTAEVTLTDWQRAVLSTLLRQVIGDICSSLRWLAMTGTEEGTDTGHGAWSNLASDSDARVFSLMSQRGLLADEALIEAITHRLYQHQLEQATRPPDTNRWTNEPTLDHPGDFFDQPVPDFSPVNRRIAAYVIDRSRRADRYGNPVLVPGEIEQPLNERLHWHVAAALRQLLADELGDDLQKLDERIEAASLETIRQSSAMAVSPTSTTEASRSLEAAGLLNMDNVHRLLKAGEIALFEESFARLAGIRPVLLRRFIYEAGGECFAILARSLDVELDQALSIFGLIRSGSTKTFRERHGGDTPLKEIYGSVSSDDAKSVRAYWRRRPEFATALWAMESGEPENLGSTLH